MKTSDKLEQYNKEIRDKWIAKSLGLSFNTLRKEKFFVATDSISNQIVVTFIPSTDIRLMQRCRGYDGTNVFKLLNNLSPID